MIIQETFKIQTSGRGTIAITDKINACLAKHSLQTGLCNLFLQHTSASLILCENADPDVRKDLETYFARSIPEGDPIFHHNAEGDDDMPAHIRTVLTQSSLSIPVQHGKLALGTWQGIYLWEHRYQEFERRLLITIIA